jgi:hypothetical protein
MKFNPHLPMKTQSLLRLLFALFSFALPVALQAEDESPGHSGSIQFSCAVWEKLSYPELFYRDGKSFLPLEFFPGSRSQLYPLKEGNALELFEKVTAADGAVTYKLVGKAPPVAGARRMLFLVDPVANAAGLPLRLYGVNDALEVFPPGTIRFFNFSTAELQVKCAGKVGKLPAGGMSLVKSNVPENGGFIPFMIGDPKGEVVFETRLFSQPTGRDMVFISAPAQPDGRLLVKVLPQLIAPEPPLPAGSQPSSSP